jgi:hypothetical protein
MGHYITRRTNKTKPSPPTTDDASAAASRTPSRPPPSGSSAAEPVKSTTRRAAPYSHLTPDQPAGGAMRKTFCFGGSRFAKRMSERATMADGCVFCDIARRAPTSTTALLYSVPYHCPYHHRSALAAQIVNLPFCYPLLCAQDDKVVAFRDINPSAFRYLLSFVWTAP